MRELKISVHERRAKVDAVARIVKNICGMSQSESFLVAKDAVVFDFPKIKGKKENGRKKAK